MISSLEKDKLVLSCPHDGFCFIERKESVNCMKRILTVQDLSCIGRCSLTVALPILSAMGLETAVLPTAVLSTHTQFRNFTFRDLTCDLEGIFAHWKSENFTFSTVYTGYLGSAEQVEIVLALFNEYKKSGSVLIADPAMGDGGKLYTGFDMEFVRQMKRVCSSADLILPNMTEASMMLGIDYRPAGYDEAYIQDVLKRLCDLGAKTSVLTGVTFHESELGAMAYDSQTDTFHAYFHEKLPVSYHGTGDCFASAFSGAFTRGQSLDDALQIAADFIVDCIRKTMADPDRRDYGVNFEEALPLLIQRNESSDLKNETFRADGQIF